MPQWAPYPQCLPSKGLKRPDYLVPLLLDGRRIGVPVSGAPVQQLHRALAVFSPPTGDIKHQRPGQVFTLQAQVNVKLIRLIRVYRNSLLN